ncbi:MAG TPA: indole-3-glycerol phosphate synthase TrpC [Vicinamibacterales bacterium]|nr:indole-3-glycerol phosphate synthase TrpC [Vicinamibacterales bacterium]
MTADLLQTIVAAAKKAADERARARRGVTAVLAADRAPRGALFEEMLRRPGLNVIAECKRRSPSRGILCRDYDPAAIAISYARAGAAAISVLTEPTFFDGSLDHLRAVRNAVELPVLRKDFIVTESQITEAVAAGADAVLLIVGALDDRQLATLFATASVLGLAVLVEVHDANELSRAIDAGASIIGVNSRNLRTLEVSLAVFDALASSLPPGAIAVAESGLRTRADLDRLKSLRYDAFLVGERFMITPDPGAALASLIGGEA